MEDSLKAAKARRLFRDENHGVSRRFVGQHVGIRLGEVVRLF